MPKGLVVSEFAFSPPPGGAAPSRLLARVGGCVDTIRVAIALHFVGDSRPISPDLTGNVALGVTLC